MKATPIDSGQPNWERTCRSPRPSLAGLESYRQFL